MRSFQHFPPAASLLNLAGSGSGSGSDSKMGKRTFHTLAADHMNHTRLRSAVVHYRDGAAAASSKQNSCTLLGRKTFVEGALLVVPVIGNSLQILQRSWARLISTPSGR
jgi:hypothetical protein